VGGRNQDNPCAVHLVDNSARPPPARAITHSPPSTEHQPQRVAPIDQANGKFAPARHRAHPKKNSPGSAQASSKSTNASANRMAAFHKDRHSHQKGDRHSDRKRSCWVPCAHPETAPRGVASGYSNSYSAWRRLTHGLELPSTLSQRVVAILDFDRA